MDNKIRSCILPLLFAVGVGYGFISSFGSEAKTHNQSSLKVPSISITQKSNNNNNNNNTIDNKLDNTIEPSALGVDLFDLGNRAYNLLNKNNTTESDNANNINIDNNGVCDDISTSLNEHIKNSEAYFRERREGTVASRELKKQTKAVLRNSMKKFSYIRSQSANSSILKAKEVIGSTIEFIKYVNQFNRNVECAYANKQLSKIAKESYNTRGRASIRMNKGVLKQWVIKTLEYSKDNNDYFTHMKYENAINGMIPKGYFSTAKKNTEDIVKRISKHETFSF